MRRVLVVRLGALGDCLIVIPLFRFLKQRGCEVYVMTQDQGRDQIFPNLPYIDKLIYHAKDSIAGDKLDAYFKAVAQEYECDECIDLCESIEVNLALDPCDPKYAWPLQERIARCNKNYYEETFRFAAKQVKHHRLRGQLMTAANQAFAKPPHPLMRSEMAFTSEEEDALVDVRECGIGLQTILWGLSGSGRNKTYPWADYVMLALLQTHPDLRIITVGDLACQILEQGSEHPRLLRASGLWSFRKSALMAKYADCVVSPDTGLLHAAGMWDTPKVGLLGHTTRENITKHFLHDFSLEAKVECAPCLRLIFDAAVQCPIDPVTTATYCMSHGLAQERVYEAIDAALRTRGAALSVV